MKENNKKEEDLTKWSAPLNDMKIAVFSATFVNKISSKK